MLPAHTRCAPQTVCGCFAASGARGNGAAAGAALGWTAPMVPCLSPYLGALMPGLLGVGMLLELMFHGAL